MNTANLQPRQFINQYIMMTHSRTQYTDEHDTYTDSYIARQQQIQLHAMLSWQIQAELKCLAEHIRQIESKRPHEYQQTIPDPHF